MACCIYWNGVCIGVDLEVSYDYRHCIGDAPWICRMGFEEMH